jgi:site-specific DNA-methyltransferase (adenine-specific)
MAKLYDGTGKIISAYKGKKSDDWFTPKWLYDSLKEEFNIDFDPCPYRDSEKRGLIDHWGKRVFVNPPYSQLDAWFEKAMNELELGNSELIIFLVFARTGTKWFHKYIWDAQQHTFKSKVSQIRFLRGRLKFGDANGSAPDDSMLVIFTKPKNE